MSEAERLTFASLAKHHDRSKFDCGIFALNNYLQKQAGQEGRKRVAFSFVMTRGDDLRVLGFYTLSASAVSLAEIPADLRVKLPLYPFMPVTLLGRLAVDRSVHGHGMGRRLLMDALDRAYRVNAIASTAVITDPKDAQARDFYTNYGFERLENESERLFLRMATIAKLVGGGT